MLRRSTLIVVFLFVVLLGFAVYLQRNPLSKAGESSPTSTPAPDLFSSGTAAIVKLRVENGEGKMVELTKSKEDGWELLDPPIAGLVDGSKVDSALLQISSAKILSRLAPAPALSTMGLENPMNRIIVGLDDNRELHIDIGVETPTRSGYYLRLDGGEAVVVSKYSIDAIIGFLENPPVLPTPKPTETIVPTPGATTLTAPTAVATVTP